MDPSKTVPNKPLIEVRNLVKVCLARTQSRCWLIVSVFLFLSSCGPAPSSGIATAQVVTVIPILPGTVFPVQTAAPPTLIPTIRSALSPTELKYRVLDQFPDFFFCDPDYYPIAIADEADLARQRFPELQANREEFQVILDHNGLGGLSSFTDDQKLLIYRDHKKLAAINFELVKNKYKFQLQTGNEGQGFAIMGTIDGGGSIDIQQRDPGFPTCPICLSENTLIDTPQGTIAVEDLRVGDLVWTMSATGERLPAAILKTVRVAVPANHQIVHVVLNDGRELWASPGHPTTVGQRLGDLKTGDLLDGARVTLLERLPYEGSATYDLLPSGGTGFYWANGILMGSTLIQQ